MKKITSLIYPWIVLIGASSLFFYTFIQINMLNPLSAVLMHDFHWSAEQLGSMSAMYFYGNFILLFPAGLILDRFSPRKIIFFVLLFASVAIFIMAFATTFWGECIGRFLQGIGGAFSFLGAIRIVSRWFPDKKLALASGCIITLSMLGGMLAQSPITSLSNMIGFRHTFMLLALLGLVLAIFEIIVVRDYPADEKQVRAQSKNIAALGFWEGIRLVIGNRYNWLSGLYTSFMNLPIWILGALWGGIYLGQAHRLSTIQASSVSMELFFGSLVGAPLVGWISDKLERRVLPMIIGALLSSIVMLLIIYSLNISYMALSILFFLLGFITSTQVLSYPTVTELNSPLLTGSATSIVSSLLVAGGFISQPLFGWLLDLHWKHTFIHHMAIYSSSNFKLAMWIMPIAFIASLFIALLMKETFCKSYSPD